MNNPAHSLGIARSRPLAALGFVAALISVAACVPTQPPSTAPSATDPRVVPAVTPSPTGCLGTEAAEMVWPQLSDIQPPQVAAGGEVKVMGSAGYVKCGASGFIESARSFRLDLDGLEVGSVSCYVNHCEGKFTLPAGLAAGVHVVTVEGGSHLSLVVTGS